VPSSPQKFPSKASHDSDIVALERLGGRHVSDTSFSRSRPEEAQQGDGYLHHLPPEKMRRSLSVGTDKLPTTGEGQGRMKEPESIAEILYAF
jgi:hypothetical protein